MSGEGYQIRSASKLNLLAEINKRKTQSSSERKTERRTQKRDGQKDSQWKTNKGLLKRLAADNKAIELENTSNHNRQTALIEKAKLYEKLRKGDMSGLNAAQKATLNVDFDAKLEQEWSNRNRDRDESKVVPTRLSDDDSDEYSSSDDERPVASTSTEEMIEVLDEFGRARTVPKSKADRYKTEQIGEPNAEHDDYAEPENVIYGDQQEFPVYEPSFEELQARQRARNLDTPIIKHYDASSEIRTRGAGFFDFSKDEEERKRQMDNILNGRTTALAEEALLKNEKDRADKAVEDRKKLLAERKAQLLKRKSQSADDRTTETEDRQKLLAEKKRQLLESRAAQADRPAKIART